MPLVRLSRNKSGIVATPETILHEYWGYQAFRPLQKEIITSILEGKDTLALLPTGGGKSVCFQVPAVLTGKLCIVVSPLIALMQDQVARLLSVGIPAASVHSGLAFQEVKRILGEAVAGHYRLLYVSPERLQSQMFQDYLDEMELSFAAIDEAHCISQWGHDFRPAYLKIATIRSFHPKIPILALTATATPLVREDIIKQLGMKQTNLFTQSFARDNIFTSVNYSENKTNDIKNALPAGSNIVYCRSRKSTQVLANFLSESGKSAAAYHAGLPKEERDHVQQAWMNNNPPVMVATTAFGMGIDKPDVRSVIHFDAPESLEAYYQEAGRAGRDGLPSLASAFYNAGDIVRLEESIHLQYPLEAYLRRIYQAVAEYLQLPIGAEPDKFLPFDIVDFCTKFKYDVRAALPAIKLLERQNLWYFTESVFNPTTLHFVVDRNTLDEICVRYPDLGYITTGLLRMYGTICYYPTPIRETAICKQLKLRLTELETRLHKLESMGVLNIEPVIDGSCIFFSHRRTDARHLIIDTKKIQELRRIHEERTRTMIGFLQNTQKCRQQMVLSYFGETDSNECGNCDVCLRKSQKPSSEMQLRTAILHFASQPNGLLLNDFISNQKENDRPIIINIVRSLLDNREILLQEPNIIYMRKK